MSGQAGSGDGGTNIVAVAHLLTVIVTNDTGDAGPSGATNVGSETGAR